VVDDVVWRGSETKRRRIIGVLLDFGVRGFGRVEPKIRDD
jgi:hypothetical protein